jgi:MoxR-like ATPase
MPNIGTLPSAADLLDEQDVGGTYGSHLQWKRDGATVVLLTGSTGIVLAQATKNDATVDLHVLGTETVPYVNAFIAHTGQRVEKYWRTKQYRIIGSTAPVAAPVSAPVVASTAPVATTAPVVEVDADLAILAETQPSDEAPIPGVEFPAKVKVAKIGRDSGFSSIGDIVVATEDLNTLNDAWKLRQAGRPASVLITGPAGTAKTALVRSFAASLGVPFLKVDGGAIRTADDWAGAFRQDPNTKVWAHRWSAFAQCLRKGDPIVILIDEINRSESTQALNALLGLLDWTGQLLVPDANTTLHLPPGILVVATANIGPEFVGTLPIDGAVRQRFPYGVRMAYPAEAIEAQLVADLTGVDQPIAEGLVRLAGLQRLNREDPQQYPSGGIISTRMVIDIAARIAICGTEPRLAVWATLKGQFDPGDEEALGICVDTQFPPEGKAESDKVAEVNDPDAPDATVTCPSCKNVTPVQATCKYCGYGLPVGATIRMQP